MNAWRKKRGFLLQLLKIVLAKVGMAMLMKSEDVRGGLELRYSNKTDLRG